MKTLFLTVGGSAPPLVTAICEETPDRAVFICTGKDPATGKTGSESEVQGIVAAAQIPLETEKILVPADDLPPAEDLIGKALAAAPGERVADFTGGTKSMGAALVLAVLKTPGVRLRVTAGARANLEKVADGSQRGFEIPLAALRFEREFDAAVAPWRRFAYDESVLLLERIAGPPAAAERHRLTRARDLARAFAAWDRFDHAAARQVLSGYKNVVGASLGRHLTALKLLTGGEPAQDPARLLDLWRNAQRRAAQGRYDDALARWYRLLEWSAQGILLWRFAIATDDVPADQLPPGFELPVGRSGRRQAGLTQAWELLAAKGPGTAAGRWWRSEGKRVEGFLAARNGSILAHGFSPVAAPQWEAVREWTEARLLPLLADEAAAAAKAAGAHPPMTNWPQLPDRYDFDAAAAGA
jgi:CRISPR-associated protein (TIGR02710 family)